MSRSSCNWLESVQQQTQLWMNLFNQTFISTPHLKPLFSNWCFLSQATTFVKWLKNNAWRNLLPPWRWSPSPGPAELPRRSAREESARGRREVRMWGHVTCICFLDGWRRRRRSQQQYFQPITWPYQPFSPPVVCVWTDASESRCSGGKKKKSPTHTFLPTSNKNASFWQTAVFNLYLLCVYKYSIVLNKSYSGVFSFLFDSCFIHHVTFFIRLKSLHSISVWRYRHEKHERIKYVF